MKNFVEKYDFFKINSRKTLKIFWFQKRFQVSFCYFSTYFFKICEIQPFKKLSKYYQYFLVFDDLMYLLACQSIKNLLHSPFQCVILNIRFSLSTLSLRCSTQFLSLVLISGSLKRSFCIAILWREKLRRFLLRQRNLGMLFCHIYSVFLLM